MVLGAGRGGGKRVGKEGDLIFSSKWLLKDYFQQHELIMPHQTSIAIITIHMPLILPHSLTDPRAIRLDEKKANIPFLT